MLERVKADPELALTPVLIVSLIAADLKARALGAAQLLQKPIQHQALIDAVYALGLGSDRALAPSVLLIDDDVRASAEVAAQLGGLNYQVVCAYDGISAVALARANPPDLIILDLLLSDLSGFDLVEALKGMPGTAEVPILLLTTGTVGQADRLRLNGHALRIMEKDSFNRQELLREVNRALRQHVPERH
ncbi:CheY-like chemotaxis protein [Oxalobacteraceae bacterium GrIS 1.11]